MTEKRDFRCFSRAKNGARAKKRKRGWGRLQLSWLGHIYPLNPPTPDALKIPGVLSSRPAIPKQVRLVNPFGRGLRLKKSTTDNGILSFNSSLGLTLWQKFFNYIVKRILVTALSLLVTPWRTPRWLWRFSFVASATLKLKKYIYQTNDLKVMTY